MKQDKNERQYRCPTCLTVSNNSEWNDATKKYFGEDVIEIGESLSGGQHICPFCNDVSDYEDIVNEGDDHDPTKR